MKVGVAENVVGKHERKSRLRLSKKLWITLLTLCVIACVIVAIVLAVTLGAGKNAIKLEVEDCLKGHEQYQQSSASKLGKYQKAAVAADSAPCSTVGKNIMLQNGSAVDAAIATGLCNGLFNPQSMGLGGGNFMLIYIKQTKMVYAFDSRERAPLDATEKMFVNNTDASTEGGLASGIPGEIAGYWQAHQIGGKLPWKALFQPAIEYCKNGITVSSSLASAIRQYDAKIRTNKGLANIYLNPTTNQTYKQNEVIRLPALAKTLELISIQGPDVFYKGNLSQTIVNENRKNNGIFRIEDLQGYKVANRTPISVRLDSKYRLFTMPPPSSGLLVSFILNVMSRYNLTIDSISDTEKTAVFYHRLVEVFKHAFAKRSYLGDMDFINVEALMKNLTGPSYISEIIRKIDDSKTFEQDYYGPGWPVKNNIGTAHMSFLAPNGDAVALTSTINTFFGAKYAGEETGIIYNNEMDDFSTPDTVNYFGVPASEPNFIKPGKRPMSSMTPIIILDENDDVRLVLGSSGGTKIITAVAQIAIKNLYLDKNIKDSIDSMRVHHQLFPEYIEIERGFSSDVQSLLVKKGHVTKCFNYGGSTAQGVERRPNNELWANSDARKGGEADGF